MRNRLRLATWIVCLLAIMVSFACVITAANNIVENNAKVIFISGTGDDANSGLSPKQAVRHLQKATELLNGAGGTIVFSGDVLENTGITIPAQKSKVIFTAAHCVLVLLKMRRIKICFFQVKQKSMACISIII